jgi:serine/threonine protein kinase
MWFYKGEEFTSEMIGDYVGFVYLITDKSNDKKYVGKKLLTSKRKLPPLKGKTRKRNVVKETDWQKYYGSSEQVKLMVEEKGVDNFYREILYLCISKGQLGYLEAKYQFEHDVLLRDDYYNGIIQCKIHRNHVRSLITC